MTHNEIEYTQIPYAPTYYISRCGKVVRVNGGIVKDIAPVMHNCGYVQFNIVNIRGSRYPIKRHRLIANTFLGLDIEPNNTIHLTHVNHIDGNRTNDAIYNLEVIKSSENIRHGRICLNGRINSIGAWFRPDCNKYYSAILINGKQKYLGRYNNEEQAHKAYIDAFIRYGLRDKYVEQLPSYKEAIAIMGEGAYIV